RIPGPKDRLRRDRQHRGELGWPASEAARSQPCRQCDRARGRGHYRSSGARRRRGRNPARGEQRRLDRRRRRLQRAVRSAEAGSRPIRRPRRPAGARARAVHRTGDCACSRRTRRCVLRARKSYVRRKASAVKHAGALLHRRRLTVLPIPSLPLRNRGMKATVCTRYGPPEVLRPAEIPKPVPLGDELLIRIHATTCHIGDVRIRGAILPLWMQLPFRLYMGILKPRHRILGMEVSGVVEAVGKTVVRFEPGDAVLASSPFRLGGYAEYICLPENGGDIRKGLVVHKPSAMTFAEAAAGLATGGLTA